MVEANAVSYDELMALYNRTKDDNIKKHVKAAICGDSAEAMVECAKILLREYDERCST
jgi:hypothetical protein